MEIIENTAQVELSELSLSTTKMVTPNEMGSEARVYHNRLVESLIKSYNTMLLVSHMFLKRLCSFLKVGDRDFNNLCKASMEWNGIAIVSTRACRR